MNTLKIGNVDQNNVFWQTDTNIIGPDGQTNYPSGNGDLVMQIGRTAGAVDVAITVEYHTEE